MPKVEGRDNIFLQRLRACAHVTRVVCVSIALLLSMHVMYYVHGTYYVPCTYIDSNLDFTQAHTFYSVQTILTWLTFL